MAALGPRLHKPALLVAIGAATMLVVVLAVVLVLQMVRGSGQPAATLTEAEEVGQALGQLNDDPAALVPEELREEIGPQAESALPNGYRADPLVETWKPNAIGGGVMTVRLTSDSGPDLFYAAVMESSETGWTVIGTFELEKEDE